MTPKIIAIINARMTSSRLPGKVIMDLNGKSVFYHHVDRMRQCKGISGIHLATSKNPSNKPLIDEASSYGIPYYAGAEEDLLERYITILRNENADATVRCAGDQPLFSHEIVDKMLNEYGDEDLLYVSTLLGKGIGLEILSLSALTRIREKYRGPAMAKYILEYPYLFKIRGVEVDDEFSRPEFRLTLDVPEDYELIKAIYERFYTDGVPVDLREVFKYLDDHPELANLNRFVEDKRINTYVKELVEKPVFSIYQDRNGSYLVKNRMGERMSSENFIKHVKTLKWGE